MVLRKLKKSTNPACYMVGHYYLNQIKPLLLTTFRHFSGGAMMSSMKNENHFHAADFDKVPYTPQFFSQACTAFFPLS